MADTIRFSRRPNRAAEIGWRPWGPKAFAEAVAADKPVFLNISTVWCQWCHQMDETAFSDDAVIRLLTDHFVPVRVDGDRYPHVQDRYIAGGWPTNAFLTPTGEMLWASTYTEAEPLLKAGEGVLAAWRERRAEFQQEVERRRRALESSRKRQVVSGLVRREAADDVLTATRDAFDPRNGGFGSSPKFPSPAAVELLYLHERTGDRTWSEMADRTLDGMLAGELMDQVDGGFFRYCTAEDWTAPRYEKLLDVNAALLRAYSLGAHLRGRRDWREAAERTVAWVDDTLRQPDGLWSGSQEPDDAYFQLDASQRAAVGAPAVDGTVYTSWNAQWITALADAGGRFGREDWVARAEGSLEVLFATMAPPDGLMYHYRVAGGPPQLSLLLADSLHTGSACIAVGRVRGGEQWLERARRLAHAIERAFWAEEGGLWDRARSDHDVGVLRYRDRPFELNADAARFLLDLTLITGDRKYRALAERILAMLSPQAGRYGVDGAAFALAVEEFFEPPPLVVIAASGDEGHPLRHAALRLPVPGLRVVGVENGARIGPLLFASEHAAAAFACGPRGCSRPLTDPDQILPALQSLI